MAARERHRQRLLDLKAEILAERDIDLEPGRQEATAVGSDEDAQPLTEMSQAIASSRNRNRSGVLALVKITVFSIPTVSIILTHSPNCSIGRAPWQWTSIAGYFARLMSVCGIL
jgi:hypothetical protein